jgi:hypothetical protein
MLPAPVKTPHVTVWLPEFATTAVNCCVPPPNTHAVLGATVTPVAGDNVTVAAADFEVASWLVAVTVTDWVVE